jgi:hypothetical protein
MLIKLHAQRLEEGPERLEFKCKSPPWPSGQYFQLIPLLAFLGADGAGGLGNGQTARSSNLDRGVPVPYVNNALLNFGAGYIQDENRQRAGSSGFWTIEYYQPYFDVDTSMVCHPALPSPYPTDSLLQVLKRCYSTLLPTSTTYLSTHLIPSADLYGPFWTLTTLIFTLYLSSSLASSISSFLSSPDTTFEYDFGLLSISVSLVYSYGIGLPVLLWIGLRYLGVGEWSVVEAVAVWGYAMFVWIPVSVRMTCIHLGLY